MVTFFAANTLINYTSMSIKKAPHVGALKDCVKVLRLPETPTIKAF